MSRSTLHALLHTGLITAAMLSLSGQTTAQTGTQTNTASDPNGVRYSRESHLRAFRTMPMSAPELDGLRSGNVSAVAMIVAADAR